MWSVVTDWPRSASARAPVISASAGISMDMPAKNGGFWTYVEPGSHSYRALSSGMGRACHFSSPWKTSP